MKKISVLSTLMVLFSFAILFTSCGDKDVAVTGVSLSKTTLALKVGENATLTATVAPDDATEKGIDWASSNNAVATVSSGKVTAIAEGTATITVTTKEGGKTAACVVTVTKDIPTPTGSGFSITFDGETWEAPEGQVFGSVSGSNLQLYAFKEAYPYIPMIDAFFPASTGTHVMVAVDNQMSMWLEYAKEYIWEGTNYDYYDWTLVEGGTFVITAINTSACTISGTFNGELSNRYAAAAGVHPTEETKPISVTMTNVKWETSFPSAKSVTKKGEMSQVHLGSQRSSL